MTDDEKMIYARGAYEFLQWLQFGQVRIEQFDRNNMGPPITIGPCISISESERACKSFLAARGLNGVKPYPDLLKKILG
jgi:hypothetical protein